MTRSTLDTGICDNHTPSKPGRTDLRIHYGPVYGREFGETMALCKPTGTLNAIMSNDFRMVDCKECRERRFLVDDATQRAKASTNHG